jgi:predicted metal-dependent HD superfamily phosphohydrolase
MLTMKVIVSTTICHLEDCLSELATVPLIDHRTKVVELALWFHDFVYDPLAKDNEEKSAEIAEEFVSDALLPDIFRIWVTQLILATKHVKIPTTKEEKLIVDIDLSILGREPHVFDAYEAQIRDEYAAVPDCEFRKGRATVLRNFYNREYIYSTEYFREKYEVWARDNINRSLMQLLNP